MVSLRSIAPLVAIAALLFVPAAASAGGSDVRTSLTRVSGSPDPDAKGRIRIRSDDQNREEFEVKAERINPSLSHTLFVENAGGAMEFVGPMQPDGNDEVRYRVRTKDGDLLPVGASSVADLAGRRVEVQQSGQAMLEGTVAAIGIGGRARVRKDLAATVLAPPRAKAQARMRSRPAKGDERFEVSARRMDFSQGQDYRLFLEDPANLGNLVDVGALVPQRPGQRTIRFRRRTKDGQALPFGVPRVGDLAGLAVQIVDVTTNNIYFDDTLPSLP
jgi:hypothetical protein